MWTHTVLRIMRILALEILTHYKFFMAYCMFSLLFLEGVNPNRFTNTYIVFWCRVEFNVIHEFYM